ncbi:receptor-like protein 31 [Gossypium hirsutum]|uniref:Receptor-like protein 31 n=1 Tax=Gossypium hirsutum TaxID=3635 RepID=A0A1U8MEK7_GOSHI|nr:receptor-like protein 31 [Gossypium hirsutum]
MANTLSFSVLILLTALLCMTVTCFNEDQSVLLQFKAHITSNPLNVWPYDWSSATSVCNWTGISCGINGRVTSLNLPNMNLYGTILPSLGKLSLLLALNMSGNSFHGHFPSELANLQRLELMDLSHNELSGGIPPWFGNLTKLQHLSLNGNNFTGNISPYLFNMINLETMDFSHNFLQGSLPHEIGNFPKLKILRL